MRVSVIINNYNYERFIGAAVESVLEQTYQNIELIVVDDGSGDRSLEVVRPFLSLLTLIAKENGGQASAYNAGFRASHGDIVIFLDADDWLFPKAIERIVAAWRSGVSKIQFQLEIVDSGGNSLRRRIPREFSDEGAVELLKKFGVYNSPPGSGNAYDAGFLRKIMPIDENRWRIAADTVPILLAPAYGKIVSLTTALGAYRRHGGEAETLLMNNAPAGPWDEYRRICDSKSFAFAQLEGLGLFPRRPMLLAPWEARIAVLCLRFGGQPGEELDCSRIQLSWRAFVSLYSWPEWRLTRKALQALWMALVLMSPGQIARKIALKHKASVGAPVPSKGFRF